MGTKLKNIFFWTYRFLQTPRKILQFAVFWAPLSKICYNIHIIGCTPNTFHNTINKNVNHSNDTIDYLNQSSFHKPACQCQGHLRTESLSASAHILHCGVKYGFGWCGPASALKIVRQLISTITFPSCSQVTVQLSKSMYFILILWRIDKIVP